MSEAEERWLRRAVAAERKCGCSRGYRRPGGLGAISRRRGGNKIKKKIKNKKRKKIKRK
jgi:hypothetical protein